MQRKLKCSVLTYCIWSSAFQNKSKHRDMESCVNHNFTNLDCNSQTQNPLCYALCAVKNARSSSLACICSVKWCWLWSEKQRDPSKPWITDDMADHPVGTFHVSTCSHGGVPWPMPHSHTRSIGHSTSFNFPSLMCSKEDMVIIEKSWLYWIKASVSLTQAVTQGPCQSTVMFPVKSQDLVLIRFNSKFIQPSF